MTLHDDLIAIHQHLVVCRQSRKRAVLAARSRRCSYQHLRATLCELRTESAELSERLAAWRKNAHASADANARLRAENADLRKQLTWTRVEDGLPEIGRWILLKVETLSGDTRVHNRPVYRDEKMGWCSPYGQLIAPYWNEHAVAWRYWPDALQDATP